MKRIALVGLVLLSPCLGRAQVVVNQAALEQLAGVAPVADVAGERPGAGRPVVHRAVRRRVIERRVVMGVAPAVMAKPVTAPAVVVPGRPVAAVPVVVAPLGPEMFKPGAGAPKVALAVVKPLPQPRLVSLSVALRFADGDDSVPADAGVILGPVCRQVGSGGMIVIDAFAPGSGSDPSMAMRDSLSRAFAVRDILTGCGVPAARIIPRADGAAGDTGLARVTLTNGFSAPPNGTNGFSAPPNGTNGFSAPPNGTNGFSAPPNGTNGFSAPPNGGGAKN